MRGEEEGVWGGLGQQAKRRRGTGFLFLFSNQFLNAFIN